MVGSALIKQLRKKGYKNIITRTRSAVDLLDRESVDTFFRDEAPEFVFFAAAKVGGILANSEYPAEFIFENLSIQTNVIDAAYRANVKKLLFLGSSCIYPKHATQPIHESELLSGYLEPTNEAYSIAKIAGIKMCASYVKQYGANFISVMPTNLYGPCDNYDLMTSHALPALLRKVHEAKMNNAPEVVVWGSGKVRREFMFSEDMADACIYLMENYAADKLGELVNIGVGEDLTIRELVELIAKVVGYKGMIVQDTEKPDGTPRKLLDVGLLTSLGWKARTSLPVGLETTYKSFLETGAMRCS